MRILTNFSKDPKGGEEIYNKIQVDFLIFMKTQNLMTKSFNFSRNCQIEMQTKLNFNF
jgi:hypothetical protein